MAVRSDSQFTNVKCHVTTHARSGNPGSNSLAAIAHVTSAQKQAIIQSILKNDFNLSGERLKIVSTALEILDRTDAALSIAEVAGLIAEGGVLAAISTYTSIASTILFPVAAMIEWVNCGEEGRRIAGIGSVGYSITAWAFCDSIPRLPARLRSNYLASGRSREIPLYEAAWKDASDAAIKNVSALIAKKPKVPKQVFQAVFRAVGDDNRQKLCRALLNGFDTTHLEKRILQQFVYPY